MGRLFLLVVFVFLGLVVFCLIGVVVVFYEFVVEVFDVEYYCEEYRGSSYYKAYNEKNYGVVYAESSDYCCY